jgi:hypothetical protein
MRPDPPSPGNAMAAKTVPQKAKHKAAGKKSNGSHKESKAGMPAAASISMRMVVTQNLINMIVVASGSGTVLLGLLAARNF